MTRKRVEVAAGVLTRPDGRYLLGQRAGDTVYAGYWEFPGGKVEAGESAAQALCRELDEELGIRVTHLRPWLRREHVYEHAHVALNFFEVTAWKARFMTGARRAGMGSARRCCSEPMFRQRPDPEGPAVAARDGHHPCRRTGNRCPARSAGHGACRWIAPGSGAQAGLETTLRADFAREVVRRVHAREGLVLINGDSGLAREVGADGVHLPARELAGLSVRPDLPWVGASCHERGELERAAAMGLDYALLGPVAPTLSHPGQPGLGWLRFSELAAGLPLPVFALGGLDASAMEVARDAGAHGIAGIRGVWQSAG